MFLDSSVSNLAPDLPSKTTASTELIRRADLLEAEFNAKTRDLAKLQITLADQELFLANLGAELAAFRVRYLREVGVLYAELDDWSDQIAAWLSKNAAENNAGLDYKAWEDRICELAGEDPREYEMPPLHRRAHAGGAGIGLPVDDDLSAEEFHAPVSLKSLYREVAKRVHPDLAADESDRRMRELLMKRVNEAYQRGDLEALRQILRDYESSPESVQGDDLASKLARVSRQITQVNARLSQIAREIEKLTKSEIGRLKARSDAAFAIGEDLLAQMATALRARIEAARRDLRERSAAKDPE